MRYVNDILHNIGGLIIGWGDEIQYKLSQFHNHA